MCIEAESRFVRERTVAEPQPQFGETWLAANDGIVLHSTRLTMKYLLSLGVAVKNLHSLGAKSLVLTGLGRLPTQRSCGG